jgi:hypothetical protein
MRDKDIYRPHSGPSGPTFENFRQGRTGPKQPKHKTNTDQSIADTFKKGFFGRLLGSSESTVEDYVDVADEIEGDYGPIDPSQYNVPAVQDWIDLHIQLENYQDVETVLAAEELGKERIGVLEYIEESDLRDYDLEQELEHLVYF